MFQNLMDRLALRTAIGGQYESRTLRRRYEDQYGIQVGMYTIGAFDRWRVPLGTKIGRYCSLARTARLIEADHPVDNLTTHPFLYLPAFGVISHSLKTEPQVVEDDVWIGHNATILPSCKRIGRGAVIGAGSIVMANVPRYAIISGDPAKLVRFRFRAAVRAAIEATKWWELDKERLAAGLKAAPDFATKVDVESAKAFYRAVYGMEMPAEQSHELATEPLLPKVFRGQLTPIIRREWPAFDEADYNTPLSDLALDSFALINLRVGFESLVGTQIHDSAWGSLSRLEELVGERDPSIVAPAVEADLPENNPAPSAVTGPTTDRSFGNSRETRSYFLNMPQMALKGLSEAWFLKEIGDIHWSILLRSLRTTSSALTDAAGERLYATFTRIRYKFSAPLTAFNENDPLTIAMSEERYGAGLFFGKADIHGPGGHAVAELMTTFSKYGEAGVNTSLLKGTPVVFRGFPIPELPNLPEIGQSYRERRSGVLSEPLFETEYEQLPPHDINGVGLLYFAAYPSIAEIGILKYAGRHFAFDFSVQERDVMYFANAEPDEILIVKLHEWELRDRQIRYEASLSRKSDGKTMALITATKVRI